MNDMNCPICGLPWSLPDRFFTPKGQQCRCDHRNTSVDLFLEIGSAFDPITPIIELSKELYQALKKS